MALTNGMTRLGMAWFAFPLQFSTALEWAGLFTCCYSCAASTAVTPEKLFNSSHSIKLSLDPLLGYERMEHLYFLNIQRNRHFFFLKKGALIQQLRSILRWLCWFKSSGCFVSRVASSQWRFSPANQWSVEFTRHVLVTVWLAWNLSWGGTEKSTRYCTQWKNPHKWTVPNHTMPYHAV